jgi:hypothetical protein
MNSEGQNLKVFENKVLMVIVTPKKRDEIAEERRK